MVGAWRDRSETSTSPGRELPETGTNASRTPADFEEHADYAESAARYAVERMEITANPPTRAAGAAQNGLSP